MVRKPCCEKEGLKKGRWTDEEDGILTRYIETHGEGSWRSVPKNAGLQRCGKSCRLRWINYLRPDLKRGNITAEEEALIIRLHASMGNRWSLIAGHLPGRTDNEIKNYWNSHLSRKHLTELTDPNDKATEPVCQAEVTAKWKPRRGRSRKRGNIKNMSTNVPVKDDMNMSMSTLGNESFEITAYINEEGAENTPSLNAEESLVFTSVHQPSHFNDDHIDILFTLDDALNIKVEVTEVDSNLSSVDQKTKLLCDKADEVAANWNERKSLSISPAGDAWDDLDWKGFVNGHKLIDEDEMLSMLWDNGSDFQCKNQL